jgi:hypothetical protein
MNTKRIASTEMITESKEGKIQSLGTEMSKSQHTGDVINHWQKYHSIRDCFLSSVSHTFTKKRPINNPKKIWLELR